MKYPITPDYLTGASDGLNKLYSNLEEYLLEQICKNFKNAGTVTNTATELIKELQRRGLDLTDIEKRIRQTNKLGGGEFNKAIQDAIDRNKGYYNELLTKQGLLADHYNETQLYNEIDAIYRQTKGQYDNLTQSLGFAVKGADGKLHFGDVAQSYQQVLNLATMKVQSGIPYNQAISEAVKALTDSGLQVVDYATGWHNRVDVACRRAVMTGISQISGKYSERIGEEIKCELYEVSAHRGARDTGLGWQNHKAWQGKVYSKSKGEYIGKDGTKYPSIYAVCGLDEVDGLLGVNCRHMYFPFVEGVSERSYTDYELADIDPPPFEFEGNTYTAYEATQKMRQLEYSIRNCKRQEIGYKSAGQTEKYEEAVIKHRRLVEEYNKFSKASKIPTQAERLNVQEYTREWGKQADAVVIKPPEPVAPPNRVVPNISSIPTTSGVSTKKQWDASQGEDVFGVLRSSAGDDYVNKANEVLLNCGNQQVIELFKKYSDKYAFKNAHDKVNCDYNSGYGQWGGVRLNASAVMNGSTYKSPMQAHFHEFGHAIDNIVSRVNKRYNTYSVEYENGKLYKTLEQDYKNIEMKALEDAKQYAPALRQYKDYKSLRKSLNKSERNMWLQSYLLRNSSSTSVRGGVSDTLEGFMNIKYPLGGGHGLEYWRTRGRENAIPKEFFAHCCEGAVRGGEYWEFMKMCFPDSVALWEKMIGELL